MFLLSVFRKTKAPLLFKRLLSISDIIVRDKIIFLSYNLIFITRVHHLQSKECFLLPLHIINSFAFKLFSKEEKLFLQYCNVYNELIYLTNNTNKDTRLVCNGNQLLLYSYINNKNVLKLKLNLLEFSCMFKKYKNQNEVDSIIKAILE